MSAARGAGHEGRPPESGQGRPPQSGAASGAAGTPPPAGEGAGRLYIVATPIGNLGDVTFRAIETLKAVPLVAAEDTRLTRRLFARYEIETRLVSYHAKSGPGREAELLSHLRGGKDLALVTDAGTPLVSDPGAELAAAWAAEGGVIVPIPGASAVLSALVAAGLAAPRFTFEGFLPRSGRERRERLARIAADDRACVIYEAPGRVAATLRDLAAAIAGAPVAAVGGAASASAGTPDRRAAVCRELTKLHEEVVRGPLAELAARAAAGELTLRGEFAIVVEARLASEMKAAAVPAGNAPPANTPFGRLPFDLRSARKEVDRLVATGLKRSEAARQVAAATGLDRQTLYRPD